ncbi:Fructoselysine 6-phosphate deglycase [Salmonella enterica subsp. enterica]|uniref:Fructoselysine 6-phosphate deglycase n=1 Tax=Salmonella enterica I TaxID=59201 RepID=A0A3S5DCA2_SALET|nr:Fructoselysine 6-phosphate deglycase [Salmonella enterica subsp. enterica]
MRIRLSYSSFPRAIRGRWDERALNFLKKYGRRIEVVDAKELGLSTIKTTVIDYFNHSLFNNVYPVYNRALAEARQHPLTTRRYMWKVEY